VPGLRGLETDTAGSGRFAALGDGHIEASGTKEDHMAKSTVSQAMTASPRAVESGRSVVEAARLMASEDVGSLPVVDSDRLVGIVTDRDLVLQVIAKDLDPNKVSVSEVASENPVVAKPDEPLDAALQRMAQEQVRRLPVVDDGRLVGILAQADVAREAKPASTGQMVEQISQQ
jgi:CBS domain-containing protein